MATTEATIWDQILSKAQMSLQSPPSFFIDAAGVFNGLQMSALAPESITYSTFISQEAFPVH